MHRLSAFLLLAALMTTAAPATGSPSPLTGDADTRSITYTGAIYDQTDLQRLEVGTVGHWFPQFDATGAVDHRPTREGAIDALPEWAAPLNHYSVADPVVAAADQGCTPTEILRGCVPTFFFRSFSQDGPAHSKGGQPAWSSITLPDGRHGRSGAIVDPHTAGNRNNTVNRIQLQGEVPAVFYLHVLTDSTGGQHDPTEVVRARGNIGRFDLDLQVEADRHPEDCGLTFNGTPDLYTYRFEGFEDGDYIKLALRGDEDGEGASFGGVLFDVAFEPVGPFRRAPRGGLDRC